MFGKNIALDKGNTAIFSGNSKRQYFRDLTDHDGYGKQNVDSAEMNSIFKTILKDAKLLNLTTIMGGNIGKKSIEFINELYNLKLLDFIETRNVILKLNEKLFGM